MSRNLQFQISASADTQQHYEDWLSALTTTMSGLGWSFDNSNTFYKSISYNTALSFANELDAIQNSDRTYISYVNIVTSSNDYQF